MEIDIKLLFFLFLFNIILFQFNNHIANKLKLFDKPDFKRKIHKYSVPITGGIFLFLNFIVLTFIFNNNYYEFLGLNFSYKREFFAIIFLVLLIFLIGLFDDRYDIKPFTKLFLLSSIILVSILIDENLIVKTLNFYNFQLNINLSNLSVPLTILFILLFLNAINMFDGIDLQVSIYFFVIVLFLSIKYNIHYLFYFSPVIILNSYFNSKNKLFLGDSGTYIIGILISWTIIKNYNLKSAFYCEEIFLIMAVPGLDMFRLFCIRIMNGKNPFKADKKHLHHLLLKKYSYLKTFLSIQFIIIIPLFFYYFFPDRLSIAILITLMLYILVLMLAKLKQ